jgi:hypothetical protein
MQGELRTGETMGYVGQNVSGVKREAEPAWCDDSEGNLEPFFPGITQRFSLVDVPDCGEPDCSGQCHHCMEYAAYGVRGEAARRRCRVVQARELGYDAESVVCTCGMCEERVVELEEQDDE